MPWDRGARRSGTRWCTAGPGARAAPGRHARARRRPRRGRAAADRRRLPQQPQGQHRRADVLALRAGARPARAARQGVAVRRPRRRCAREHAAGHRRQIVGLEVRWTDVEAIYQRVGLPPAVPAAASRVAVPVYKDRRQVGKATSTAWSPTLKRLIALATIDRPHFADGTELQMEITVEATRYTATATVVPTPFLKLPRRTARRFVTGPVTVASTACELAWPDSGADPVTNRLARARRASRNDWMPLPRYQASSTTVAICASTAGRAKSSVPAATPGSAATPCRRCR